MDGSLSYPLGLEYTVMSPGLDAWRREKHCSSSSHKADSMLPSRSGSRSPDRTGGQREGLPEERENAQGQGPLQSVDKIDENLTTDRVRTLRSFKFALVEYLKDLLKPHWKEGRLSRDAHKLIVKKSVNKVVESFGGSEIPSDRKIDYYLNSSHSKLQKLIQAYVEKYQKG